MPKIILKYKSPEFAETGEETKTQSCDMPGCPNFGQHKAPKHRGLNEYYNFCFDHVREYNKAWDFFQGMSNHEVQSHMEKSLYGDRPTWKYGVEADMEEKLFKSAQNQYFYGEEPPPDQKRPHFGGETNTPEYEAMAIMGLTPPVTLEGIKERYKKLAKKHHPDINRNNPDSEELLKKINMAYTILKVAFDNYQKLADK